MITASYYTEILLPQVPGWCSKDKAEKLIQTIRENDLKLCVEIGVFGGSSFFPQALAMKDKASGMVIGIDPWTKDSALEDMTNEANKNWWGSLNLETIYNGFMKTVEKYDLQKFCTVFRNKSEHVVDQIQDESVDLLHIDGNHCERLAYQDSVLFLPKVKQGGYIFFDDISWVESGNIASTRKGLSYLRDFCDEIGIIGKDCMILQKK